MGWHIKNNSDNHIECSLCKAPTVYLESIPRTKIELLMEAYPNTEWFAYLVGKTVNGNIFVEDISVPPHAFPPSSISAEADKPYYNEATGKYQFHSPANTVGCIHSHHQMGAFHSGIDQMTVDKNYPISITVAKRSANLEFDTVCYQITPCGKATTGKSVVKYVQPKPLFDTEKWLSGAKANIDRKVIVINTELDIASYEQRLKEVTTGGLFGTPQPRDKHGKFLPKDSYVPVRYRITAPGLNYITDQNGRVLTNEEAGDILHNSL